MMGNTKKKAQFAIEFVILITFMLIIFIGFFSLVTYRMIELEDTEKQEALASIAGMIENEVKLAKSLNNGYRKFFKTPKQLDGHDYSIDIVDNREISIQFYEYEHVVFLPEKSCGDPLIGVNNEIWREKDWICLNACWTEPECENIDTGLGICDAVENTFPGTECWCCNLYGYCCP